MSNKRERMKRPAALTDLMASLFRGKPLEKRLDEGRIWLVWDKAVGAQIAAKARPVAFRDGVLTVAVASAPWMQQLNFLKAAVIEKLNAALGCEVVGGIYLKAGTPPPAPSVSRIPPKKERSLPLDEQEHVTGQVAAIPDPELREAVKRLLCRHLSHTPAD